MLPNNLPDLLKMAKDLWGQLADLEEQILSNHRNYLTRQLEAARQIRKQRPEVLALINQLGEILDEETLANSEAIINAPLFHPLFEELMEVQSNGTTDEQLFKEEHEELKEDIEDHYDLPYPEEIKVLQELRRMHGKMEEAAQAAFDADNIPMLYELLDSKQQQAIASSLLEEGLKSQIERLSDTFYILKDSPFSYASDAAEEEQFADELDGMSQFMNRLKLALEKSIETRQASPGLILIMQELEDAEQEMQEAGMDEWLEGFMEDEDYEMEDLFDDFLEFDDDDEDWDRVVNPKFPEGSVVAITNTDWLPEVYGIGSKQQFTPPKDARGRVMEAYTNGEKLMYEIALDSQTLKALPVEYIQHTCREADDSFAYHLFDEKDLKASTSRDTESEALITYKQLFNRYFWGNIEKDEDARIIHDVLMTDPKESDLSNWHHYFSETVEFPFSARVEGLIGWGELLPETEVEVLTLASLERQEEEEEEEEMGLLVFVKHGSETLYFPLVELLPLDEKSDTGKAVLAYRWWADMMV